MYTCLMKLMIEILPKNYKILIAIFIVLFARRTNFGISIQNTFDYF